MKLKNNLFDYATKTERDRMFKLTEDMPPSWLFSGSDRWAAKAEELATLGKALKGRRQLEVAVKAIASQGIRGAMGGEEAVDYCPHSNLLSTSDMDKAPEYLKNDLGDNTAFSDDIEFDTLPRRAKITFEYIKGKATIMSGTRILFPGDTFNLGDGANSLLSIDPDKYEGAKAQPDKPGYYLAKKYGKVWEIVQHKPSPNGVYSIKGFEGVWYNPDEYSKKWIFIMPLLEGQGD